MLSTPENTYKTCIKTVNCMPGHTNHNQNAYFEMYILFNHKGSNEAFNSDQKCVFALK